MDLNNVVIKINPAMTDVRLADVLDAIVVVADHPIKYSIEDYAIVFMAKGPASHCCTAGISGWTRIRLNRDCRV